MVMLIILVTIEKTNSSNNRSYNLLKTYALVSAPSTLLNCSETLSVCSKPIKGDLRVLSSAVIVQWSRTLWSLPPTPAHVLCLPFFCGKRLVKE